MRTRHSSCPPRQRSDPDPVDSRMAACATIARTQHQSPTVRGAADAGISLGHDRFIGLGGAHLHARDRPRTRQPACGRARLEAGWRRRLRGKACGRGRVLEARRIPCASRSGRGLDCEPARSALRAGACRTGGRQACAVRETDGRIRRRVQGDDEGCRQGRKGTAHRFQQPLASGAAEADQGDRRRQVRRRARSARAGLSSLPGAAAGLAPEPQA